jgi:hypothetical protein
MDHVLFLDMPSDQFNPSLYLTNRFFAALAPQTIMEKLKNTQLQYVRAFRGNWWNSPDNWCAY